MLSSTLRPRKRRDCWYVRARPSFARWRAGITVTSWPSSSTVPDVAVKSPAITLKRVVLPAPFGPRIARRSACNTSRSTSRTACRPPKRRPTPLRRRAGAALSASGAACVTYLLDDAVDDRPLVADPRKRALHAGRGGAAGRRRFLAERAAERLVDLRDELDRLDIQLAAGVGVELLRVLVGDRIPVLVEPDRPVPAVQHDLVERGLECLLAARQVTVDRLERGDQRPGVVVVVVDEAATGLLRSGALQRRHRLDPLADDAAVLDRGRRLQVGSGAEATGG